MCYTAPRALVCNKFIWIPQLLTSCECFFGRREMSSERVCSSARRQTHNRPPSRTSLASLWNAPDHKEKRIASIFPQAALFTMLLCTYGENWKTQFEMLANWFRTTYIFCCCFVWPVSLVAERWERWLCTLAEVEPKEEIFWNLRRGWDLLHKMKI